MSRILGICGDSFMSPISKDENNLENGHGKHFIDLLSKMLNCEIVTYAKGGVSNNCIRLQIEEIMKHNPTYIIIGTTSPDRLEIPLKNLSVNSYEQKWENYSYIKKFGLLNIEYNNSNDLSSLNNEFENIAPTLKSNTIYNFLHENIIDTEKKDILNNYFQHFYDLEWKRQIDIWVISEGIYKLLSKNFNFSLINTHFEDDYFSFCEDSLIKIQHELNPWTYYSTQKKTKNPFHLNDEDSEILANKWYNFLKDKF